MRPVRPSWQALECLLTVAIEPKADMLDFGPYDDLVSTNQKSVPEVREWMVVHPVHCEPVSPCILRKCREIFPKCRETVAVTRLKAIRSQQLG